MGSVIVGKRSKAENGYFGRPSPSPSVFSLSLCLSVSVCLSVCLSVSLSVCVSVSLSRALSQCSMSLLTKYTEESSLVLWFFGSLSLSVSLSVCLSVSFSFGIQRINLNILKRAVWLPLESQYLFLSSNADVGKETDCCRQTATYTSPRDSSGKINTAVEGKETYSCRQKDPLLKAKRPTVAGKQPLTLHHQGLIQTHCCRQRDPLL